MIRLTPPTLALTPPPAPAKRSAVLPVVPIGDSVAVCESTGWRMVEIEVHGKVYNGRVLATLTPDQAQNLAVELSNLARRLRA